MEEYNKRVSVIIPVYNVEKYIEKCLDSVCNQTLREIEIICVNDGSTDKSMEPVKRKAKEDKRIVILEKENGGLSSARNAGLDIAGGEYVLFLDSDDTLVLHALEYLYDKASKNRLDNIFFGATTVYENFKVKLANYRKYSWYYNRKGNYPEVLNGAEMFCTLINNKEYRMSACLQMPRRQFLIEKGFRFYEGILHEDNLFTLQVLLAADRVMVDTGKFYNRLMRSGSIMTAKGNVQSSWGYFVCLTEMLELAKKYGNNPEVSKTIHYVLMTTQREAVLPIQGMSKEAVLEKLGEEITSQEKLRYELLVLNGEWMRQQRRLSVRIANRLKR